VFLVVQPVQVGAVTKYRYVVFEFISVSLLWMYSKASGVGACISVAACCKDYVPPFRPFISSNVLFDLDDHFRGFLFTKSTFARV
jgi:hypothetical protein